MVTALQLVLAGGALVGLGLVLLLWRLVPVEPDLADALRRVSPQAARRPRPRAVADPTTPRAGTTTDRLGTWGMRVLPAAAWGRVPTEQLAILRIPVHRFYGQKILYGFVGLLIVPFLSGFFTVLGLRLPIAVPVIATVVLAVVMFFLPNYNAYDDAKKARVEFTRSLAAYIDLVALERAAGSGSRQAMEVAADVGDSWVFRRIREELARSRWSGEAPWQALHGLAAELGLRELDDLADIMRLSGEEGARVYTNLRARSAGLRTQLLTADLAKANDVGQRMQIPGSLLGVVFLAILIAPALLRLVGGST